MTLSHNMRKDQTDNNMNAVVQEESTGCGIAASAVIAGVSYQQAKQVANQLGIYAEDRALWSDTAYVRRLLSSFDIATSPVELPFTHWNALPDKALLAIRWKIIAGKPYWHWVVFERTNGEMRVLDSNRRLRSNIRYDFNRMQPKWFITITA